MGNNKNKRGSGAMRSASNGGLAWHEDCRGSDVFGRESSKESSDSTRSLPSCQSTSPCSSSPAAAGSSPLLSRPQRSRDATSPSTSTAPPSFSRQQVAPSSAHHNSRADLSLLQYGIGVPKGDVAHSAAEAEKVAKGIGMPFQFEALKSKSLSDSN